VVPRLYAHDHAYIFQNADGRIVFAIPYEHDYTLIGTTDEDFRGDLSAPTASAAEINYLCGAVSGYFRKGVTPDQVVHAYSGVRQLYDDGARSAQNLTREYLLDLDGQAAGSAAAHRLWRQDHHLPHAGRGGAGQARADLAPGRDVDRRCAAPRRRLPA
jgi:glycerol-3-phosphate dehydrogenase